LALVESSLPVLSRPGDTDTLIEPDEDGDGLEEQRPFKAEPPADVKKQLVDWIDNHNIARDVDPRLLGELGMLVVREFDIDDNTRGEWKQEAEEALKFATQVATEKQYPWPKASNIIYPLITRAAIEFAAMTYPAIVRGRNIVRGMVWGGDDGTPATQDGDPNSAPILGPDNQPVWLVAPGAKQIRADKVGEHMSWQLLDEMEYWEWQTDTLLHQLPIVGGAVRKTYRNFVKDRNESVLVSLMNIVWNKNAKSFAEAPRHSELFTLQPYEIEERERDDENFLTIQYGVGGTVDDPGEPGDSSNPQEYIEQHRRYDLDGDGYPEPLIVTVHRQSSKVVRIVARYEAIGIIDRDGEILRIEPVDHYTLYPFFPDPRGGSYPIGFGHLLKPLNEAINTSMNQMFDAGHLQIAGGGFVGTSLSLHAGPVNFRLGEYKPVNTKGGNIRDSVMPLPFPGPNQVLFELLGFLTKAAEQIAATQNIISADAAGLANIQPTTLVLLISQGMRTYTAIHQRIYRSLKSEFAKLFRLNRLFLQRDQRYRIGDTWRVVKPEDYRLGGGVEPVSDPREVTDMQRLGRAIAIKEFANDPLCNPMEVRRRYFEALQIERIDKLLVQQPPGPSPDQQAETALTMANIGRARAAELKDQSQAVLNMALARAKASGPEMDWIDKQLEVMRMHIEALNTTVKAADVDAKVHGHNMHLKATQERARQVSNERPSPEPPSPGPAPIAPQPAGSGPLASSLPTVAPPSGNANGSALPVPPGGGLPGGGPGPVGIGGT